MSTVYLGGSRKLSASPLVKPVVSKLLAAGHKLSVGCAIGADALVIQAALTSPLAVSNLFIHTIINQQGAGGWSGTAVSTVLAAAKAGVSVNWSVGSSQVHGKAPLPLVNRLMLRSVTGLTYASVAVFFSPGSGSLKVAAQAVKRGITVIAFSPMQPVPLSVRGGWVAGSFVGFSCWRWVKP